MKSFFNRAPLSQNTKVNLDPGKIRPAGWLKAEMVKQLSELGGAFDRALAGQDENAPAALDALVYMAFVLDDENLKAKAKYHIDRIMDSQDEEGWFGGKDNRDYLPLILLSDTVYAYFTATGDKRALLFLDGFFKYEYKNLSERPLTGRACALAADNMYVALKLYNITGQRYLIELCRRLREQMLDWTNIFHTFPNVSPMAKSMSRERLREGMESEKGDLVGTDHPFFATYYHQSEGVNVASGLKAPGVVSLFKTGFKEINGFAYGWEKLMKYHGSALGMFSCDEHLNGTNPSAGVRTKAVSETLRSLETLLDIGNFGDNVSDILEKLAYNALPAALGPKGRCQKLQQTNQLNCVRGGHNWYNSEDDANVFSGDFEREGLFDALSAQARFVSSLWQATSDGGLSAVSYAPCTLSHVIDSTPVKLRIETNYPFSDSVEISVGAKKPLEFPLYLRIPSWAVNPMIHLPNGEIMSVRAGETACLRQRWNGDGVIRLVLPGQCRVRKWSRQSASVEVGPLLMALPLKAKTDDHREYRSSSDWAWALKADESMKLLEAQEDIRQFKVLAKFCRTDLWPKDGADAGTIPILPPCRKAEEETLELAPYCFTVLRLSQFPIAKMEEENA